MVKEGLCYKYRVNSRVYKHTIPKDAPVPQINDQIRIIPRDRIGNSHVIIKEGRVISETNVLIVVSLKNNGLNECYLKSDFRKGILKFEHLDS